MTPDWIPIIGVLAVMILLETALKRLRGGKNDRAKAIADELKKNRQALADLVGEPVSGNGDCPQACPPPRVRHAVGAKTAKRYQ